MKSRLRFSLAITLAAVLGGWLLYTSLGGALETYAGPGELQSGTTYRLNGIVAKGVTADPQSAAQSDGGLAFTVVSKDQPRERTQVLYRGSVPDQFRAGREVVVTGELQDGIFVARRNSLVALCPSKFSDDPAQHQTSDPPV